MESEDSSSDDSFTLALSLTEDDDDDDDDDADIAKLDAFFAEMETENPTENTQDSSPIQETTHTINTSPTESNRPISRLDAELNGQTNNKGNVRFPRVDSYSELALAQIITGLEDEQVHTNNDRGCQNVSNDLSLDLPNETHRPSSPTCRPIPISTGYGKGIRPDLAHLFSSNNKAQADLKYVEDALLSKLELIRYYKCVLQDELQEESKRRLEELQDCYSGYECAYVNLTIPYFKDKYKFPAPLNSDEQLKRSRNECQNLNETPHVWSEDDVKSLEVAIKESEIEGIIEKRKQEREALLRKIKDCHKGGKNHIKNLQEQLKQLVVPDVKCRTLNDKTLEELLGNREREHDWLKISATYLDGRFGPLECQMFWTNYLNPKINKKEWTKSEDHQLKTLCIKFKEQDWDTIAKTLNTGRSSLQCAQRFHASIIDGHLTRVWFSKEEDALLKEKVELAPKRGKKVDWDSLLQYFPRRSRYQLYHRWSTALNPQLKDLKFSADEEVLLLSMVRKHGKRFAHLKKYFPGRHVEQLKRRYQQLTLDVTRGNWSREDDDVLYRLGKKHDEKSWTLISKHFAKRTASQCRFRYLTLKSSLRKQFEETGVQDLSKLKVNTRVPVTMIRQTQTAQSRRHKAVLELEEAVGTASTSKRVKKPVPKKKVLKKLGRKRTVSKETFAKFREYVSVRYKTQGGRRRKCLMSRGEVAVCAQHLWLLLGALAANLTNLPNDNSVVQKSYFLDNLTKVFLVHFKENNISLQISTGNETSTVPTAFDGLEPTRSKEIPPSAAAEVESSPVRGRSKTSCRPVQSGAIELSRVGPPRMTYVRRKNTDTRPAIVTNATAPLDVATEASNVVTDSSSNVVTDNSSSNMATDISNVAIDLPNVAPDISSVSIDLTDVSTYSLDTTTEPSIILDLEIPVVSAGDNLNISCSKLISSEVRPLKRTPGFRPVSNNVADKSSLVPPAITLRPTITLPPAVKILKTYARPTPVRKGVEEGPCELLASTLPVPKSALLVGRSTDGRLDEINHLPTLEYHKIPRGLNVSSFSLCQLPPERRAPPIVYLPPDRSAHPHPPAPPTRSPSPSDDEGGPRQDLTRLLPPALNTLVGFRTLLKCRRLLWEAVNPACRTTLNRHRDDGGEEEDPVVRRNRRRRRHYAETFGRRRMVKRPTLPDKVPGEDLWMQRFECLFWFPAIMSARQSCAAEKYYPPNKKNPFRALEEAIETEYPPVGEGGDSDASETVDDPAPLEGPTCRTAEDEQTRKPKRRPKMPFFKGPKKRGPSRKKKKKKVEEGEGETRMYVQSGKFTQAPTVYARASPRTAGQALGT